MPLWKFSNDCDRKSRQRRKMPKFRGDSPARYDLSLVGRYKLNYRLDCLII